MASDPEPLSIPDYARARNSSVACLSDFADRGSALRHIRGAVEVLHSHCVGLDLYRDSVVAYVRYMAHDEVTTDVRTFKTTTEERMALSNGLSAP